MPTTIDEATLTVALIGNPNTGKSTLFGALVGIHQHVGNYPGVTVEKKTGRMEHEGRRFELVDLPGLYSLAARSRDEMVAVEVLLQRQSDIGAVDVVLCIVDGSNLERHLYLVSQVLELGLPTVVAVNMLDVAASRGIKLELRHLQSRLGIAVVPIQANRGYGLAELKAALIEAVRRGPRADASLFPEVFEKEVRELQVLLATQGCHAGCDGSGRPGSRRPRCSGQLPPAEEPRGRCCRRRWCGDCSWMPADTSRTRFCPMPMSSSSARCGRPAERVEAGGCPIPAVETTVRYAWARSMLQGVVSEPKTFAVTVTDRIDRVLTHRVWGLIVFAVVMLMVFQSVFVWARPLMDAIGAGFDWLGGSVESLMPEGALRSLLAVGVIGGVGGVVQFLPQILILFTFIALLEDCGYMARAAYLDGPRDGPRRPERPVVHSHAVVVRLRRAGHHGRAGDRERARPADDDSRRPAADLLGPFAGLCPADRGLRAADDVSWRHDRFAGADAGRALRPGNRGRGEGGPGAETDDPPRRHAALRDGDAQLQVALAADRGDARVGAGLDLPAHGRIADPGHFHRGLGRRLLSAQSPRRAGGVAAEGEAGGRDGSRRPSDSPQRAEIERN